MNKKKNKKPIGRPYRISRKEGNLFFVALIAGISMGVVGNLVISSLYDVLNSYDRSLWSKWVIFGMSIVALFGVLVWLNKKIINNAYS